MSNQWASDSSIGDDLHTQGTIKALIQAKTVNVLYPMLAKAGGVTITTMKLKIQFPVVEIALAGARMANGVISAG